jgi:hypothetical protein
MRVLCRLLLGTDGAAARRRRDERALDRPARVTHSSGEGRSLRPSDRSRCWRGSHRGRYVVILDGNVLTVTARPNPSATTLQAGLELCNAAIAPAAWRYWPRSAIYRIRERVGSR